ncbi:DUF1674 domain-containing protein [Cardiobacteriaceae bacterium TAE3-ERU3]|nr:DUF1674 domain-containing protein [Cardiobacteriaceae bacterium TAE3-ERU3]
MTHQPPEKYTPQSAENAKPNSAEAQHVDSELDNNQSTKESGGPSGPEPTRYGDWERKGRCIDF